MKGEGVWALGGLLGVMVRLGLGLGYRVALGLVGEGMCISGF